MGQDRAGTVHLDDAWMREELTRAGVLGGVRDDTTLLLQEARCLLAPSVHEGAIVRYGIVAAHKFEVPTGAVLAPAMAAPDVCRYLADGSNSFAIIEAGQFLGTLLLPKPLISEGDFVLFREQARAELVGVVLKSGEAVFCTAAGVALQHHRRWHFKPTVRTSLAALVDHASNIDRRLAEGVLSFCSHVLSPNKVGASIVLEMVPLPEGAREAAKPQVNLEALPFNMHGKSLLALASILATHDGATVVAPDGGIRGIGAQLVVSQQARSLICEDSGTRHTSARRFSYDWPEVVVFTVSADGPVSVFSDGALIAQVQFGEDPFPSDFFEYINNERGGDVQYSEWDEKCPRCGKTHELRDVLVPGWRERENVSCFVCGETVASVKTFALTARLVKRLRDRT